VLIVRGWFAGAEDDVCGHAALGEASGVGAVEVVADGVLLKVVLEGGGLGDE